METIQILIKPVSDTCNIHCQYCFYKDEVNYRKHRIHSSTIMSEEVVDAIIQKGLSSASMCTFAFQGGEPTLAGLSFYETFIKKVNTYKKPNQQVFYTIQTNGMHLSKEWALFFKQHHFLVGISLDGMRSTHNANRVDGNGNGTFVQVMQTIKLFQTYHIHMHVLCVLNRQTAERIDSIYHFFVRNGLLFQQYIPCLDPLNSKNGIMQYSLSPQQYANALKQLFDLWFANQVQGTPVFIRDFTNYVSMLTGQHPEACSMYGKCNMQNIVERDGTIYPCDFYALDRYAMGNILDTDFIALQQESLLEKKGNFFEYATKRDERCSNCKWYPLCRGGCRRTCEMNNETWRNIYCETYQQFFSYAISKLEWLAANRF